MTKVWILFGVDTHSNDVLGVYATEDLAYCARENVQESYAFLSVQGVEVRYDSKLVY